MRLRLLFLALLLMGLATSSGGCLAVAVGAGAAGTVAYMRGDLETQEPYGLEPTYDAVRKAMNQLGLNIIEEESDVDALSARVTARDSSDKKIVVRCKAITANATKLTIRVGTFGDEGKTRRIYIAICDRLKTDAVTTAPQQPVQTASESTTPDQPESVVSAATPGG